MKNTKFNLILNVIGLLLLATSIFLFGLREMISEMGIAVVASAIFLAFANLDKFSEFKGAGFEAKMRHVVDEANATIDNLKEVAKPLIKTNLISLAKAGRFSSGAFNKNHELYDQLIELQQKLDLTGSDIEESKSKYLNIHAWDMISELSDKIGKSGESNFYKTYIDTIGTHNFEKAPDLSSFNQLIEKIQLNDECKKNYEALKRYYVKYDIK